MVFFYCGVWYTRLNKPESGGEYSMFYNAKEKLLEIQDIQMNYITFGKGEKPLILI